MTGKDPRWAEVARIRAESDERLNAGDVDAVYALDAEASALARAILKSRRAEKMSWIREIRRMTTRRLRRKPTRKQRRAKFAAKYRRQIEIHGIDVVRARKRMWARAWHERNRGSRPRFVSTANRGPETMAALDAAKGNQVAARKALGITKVALFNRINNGVAVVDGEEISVRTWLDRTWPQRRGHRATPVLSATVEHGVRVYVLAAHGEAADGEHVNRVPAVGAVRARVVCQVCREARTG